MAKYRVIPGRESQFYIGKNPATGDGLLKKKLGDFSQEELEGWVKMNPETSREFVQVSGGTGGQALKQEAKQLPKPPKA